MNAQLDLLPAPPADVNVEWLVGELQHRGWTFADELLRIAGLVVNEDSRRYIRKLAKESGGRVIGGQRGYKLTRTCTQEEYNMWRNTMKSQADEMTGRVLEADKVFYSRQPVASGNGILS